jgi:hypothetical protein
LVVTGDLLSRLSPPTGRDPSRLAADNLVRAFVIAFGLGAGYGILAFEAVSPLALVLLLWLALILIWVWRLPLATRVLGFAAIAFLAGFAAVWLPVLGHIAATCVAPSCQTADAATDLFYAIAFIAPVMLLAGAETGLRMRRLRRRTIERRSGDGSTGA